MLLMEIAFSVITARTIYQEIGFLSALSLLNFESIIDFLLYLVIAKSPTKKTELNHWHFAEYRNQDDQTDLMYCSLKAQPTN